jgi:ubiquinone/menaquinone biosynthesis C-methylase UbiE
MDQRQAPFPPSTGVKETTAWHDAYNDQLQVERRRQAIPAKLRKLGLNGDNPQATIMDLCCGNGETLEALYEMGYRNLSGIDLVINPQLARDSRFTTLQSDASRVNCADNSLDWILIVHALHHLGPVEQTNAVLKECLRALKPGGRLAIVDFPNSLQIRLAFWFFRQNVGLVTPYLKYFGKLIQEEWPFLKSYLREWKQIRILLHNGQFEVSQFQRDFFYFYLTLQKPRALEENWKLHA